jgi:hypothetical protein
VEISYDVAGAKVTERTTKQRFEYDVLENNALGLVATRHYAEGDQRHRTVGAYTLALDKHDRTMVRSSTFTDSDDPGFRRGDCVEREAQ